MAGWTSVTVFLCVLTFVPLSAAAGTQCLSNTGTPVDWFIAYKIPENVKSLPPNTFYYMDAVQTSWTRSSKTIDQPGQAIYYTLDQIYNHSGCKNMSCSGSDLLYAMYNDQRNFSYPGWRSDSRGHTKGVVAFDRDTGFWLIHSTPNFAPPKVNGYKWPCSGHINGQTFLCISMKTDTYLNVIGEQLAYNYPHIYDKASSDYFDQKFPNMASVLRGKHINGPPWFNEVELRSLSGASFLSFAKFSKFEKDLYADWLAPYFKDNLLVETWQRGSGGKLCSNCTITYRVYNIGYIAFQPNIAFNETTDHSKWAITQNQQWTCIGDINRMVSQEHRAGGTVCMKNSDVWNSFHSIINSTRDCGVCA